MTWEDRIQIDPAVLAGKPTINGTRISVAFVVGLLAIDWSVQEIVENHDITLEDVRACLAYASDVLRDERVYPLPA